MIEIEWIGTPFPLIEIEREYSTPEIENSWKRKVTLTKAEAKVNKSKTNINFRKH